MSTLTQIFCRRKIKRENLINDRSSDKQIRCPFLVSARKGRKEADIRGTFYKPSPLYIPLRNLTGPQVTTIRRECTDSRPSVLESTKLQAENRDIFCLNRIWVKVLRANGNAGLGFPKGVSLARGSATTQRPFGLLLLVLFLQEQEKNKESFGLLTIIYISLLSVVFGV